MDDDFTDVATWKGVVSFGPALGPVAGKPSPFVIDAYARKIVGWRVSTSAHAVADRARTDGATIGDRPRRIGTGGP